MTTPKANRGGLTFGADRICIPVGTEGQTGMQYVLRHYRIEGICSAWADTQVRPYLMN